MAGGLPAITGVALIKLLKANGWAPGREGLHGLALTKTISGECRITTVKKTKKSLPQGTLSAILGPRQTGIGRAGLKKLLEDA